MIKSLQNHAWNLKDSEIEEKKYTIGNYNIEDSGQEFHETPSKTKAPQIHDEDSAITSRIFVNGICLDDLIPYIRPGKGVFLKMDVEGSEANVLKCASRFMRDVDVRVVLMEIMFHKYTAEGREMVQYMLHNNMIPSEDALGKSPLQPGWLWAWPDNVYWVKGR